MKMLIRSNAWTLLAASNRNDGRTKVGDDFCDEGSVALVLFTKQIELLLFEETGCAKLNRTFVEVNIIWDETDESKEILVQTFAYLFLCKYGSRNEVIDEVRKSLACDN